MYFESMINIKRKILYYSVLQLGITFFSVPIYLDLAGKEYYGVYLLYFMPILAVQIFDLGVSKTISILAAKEVQNGRNNFQWLSSLGFTASLASTGLYFSLILLAILLNNFYVFSEYLKVIKISLIIGGCLLPIIFYSNNLIYAIEGLKEFDFILPYQFLAFLAMHFGGILGFYLFQNLDSGIIGALLARSLTQVFFIKSALSRYKSRPTIISLNKLRSELKYARSIGVTNFFTYAVENLDKYLLAIFLSPAASAIYMICFNLITKVRLVPEAVCKADFPAYAGSTEVDAFNRNKKSTFQISIIVTVLLALFVLFQNQFYRMWLRIEDISEFSKLTPFFVGSVYVSSLAYPSYSFVEARGAISKLLKIYMITSPLYFFYLLLLIDSYGSTGAAFAWSVRIILDSLVLVILVKMMSEKLIIVLLKNSLLLTLLAFQSTLNYNFSYQFAIFMILIGSLYYDYKYIRE
jgi:O-antigen/teichoic acid export membrane protein